MNLINTFLPSLQPWAKYTVAIIVLILFIFILQYLAKMVQWLTDKLLAKKNFLSKGWLNLMTKNKLFSNIFFAFELAVFASVAIYLLIFIRFHQK